MISADLTSNCGLFSRDVTGLSLRGVDDDLFCWVSSSALVDHRLLALSADPDDARKQLASVLEAEHGFSAADSTLAAQRLFNEAFGDLAGPPRRHAASAIDLQGWEMSATQEQQPSRLAL